MSVFSSKFALASLSLVLLALAVLAPAADCWRKDDPAPKPVFDREQFMVMMLDHGKDSTGYYLQESLRSTRLMYQQLDKASHQLDQVDRAFARSRGRPDSRYLSGPAARIEQAKTAAENLMRQLEEAQGELKDSIHHLLLKGD